MREGLSRLPLALVLVAFCFPLFIGLGSTDLDNDEAIYSYAVESILTTGDWLGPRSSPSRDEVFLEKPHLKLWIVAAPIRMGVLPLNEFGLRFWDALFGALSFVYVFLVGRRLRGPVCGAVAVLVLFAQEKLLFDHGFRSNNMDAALVLAYCGGVYHYLRWTSASSGRAEWIHAAATGGWFYLGFMSKFVAAIFLPAILGICAVAIPSHRRRLIDGWRRWMAVSAAVTAAIVPWFVYEHLRHGALFWKILLGEHVVTRFTTYVDPSHLQPWYFYVVQGYREFARSDSAIWVGLGLLLLIVDAVRRRTFDAWVVLAWAAVPLTAISFGSSKLYHYLYPFIPPFALAAGYGIAALVEGARRLTPGSRGPEGVRTGTQRAVRIAAVAIMLLAVAMIVATAVSGTFQVHAGDRVLFRNSSLLRPAFVAVACAAAINLRVAAAGALALALAILVPTPIRAYEQNLQRLSSERHILRNLGRCIQGIDRSRAERGLPSGAYAPVSEGYLHQYFFYLRGTGWLRGEIDERLLYSALFVEGQERPVVMDPAAYSAFLERHRITGELPAAVNRSTIIIVLPGEYRACRETQAPVAR